MYALFHCSEQKCLKRVFRKIIKIISLFVHLNLITILFFLLILLNIYLFNLNMKRFFTLIDLYLDI